MKKISERFSESLEGVPLWLPERGISLLVKVLDEYQADVEKRLAEILKEAKTAKPFYEQGYGR